MPLMEQDIISLLEQQQGCLMVSMLASSTAQHGFPLLEITIIKVGSITKTGKRYPVRNGNVKFIWSKKRRLPKKKGRLKIGNKGNNKITEFRTIFQRESQNS